jgi:hypothetical protein
MPRKVQRGPTLRVARLTATEFAWLVGQDMPPETPALHWHLLQSGTDHPGTRWHPVVLWESGGDLVLDHWTAVRPGTRPPGFWRGGATEPRRQLSGTPRRQDPQHPRMQWRERWREQDGLRTGQDYRPQGSAAGASTWESMGAYLDRLGLWLEGERERAPADCWEPVQVED